MFHDLVLDLLHQIGVLFQSLLGIFSALSQLLILIAEPCAAFFHDAQFHRHVNDLAGAGDALSIEDVEFCLTERRRHLILVDLHLGAVADLAAAVLDGFTTAHFHADRGVELQRTTAGRCLRVAVHNADLFPDLVDEDCHALGLGNDGSQLSHCLGHQSRQLSHVAVTHFAVDLRLGGEGCHRVHDQHVDGTGAHQRLGDFQRLLTAVRLGHQQAVDVDAQRLGIGGVEGVFHVDECHFAAHLLRLGNDVQGNGGLTGAFRTVQLHDTSPWHAADAQRHVQHHRAGRDRLYIEVRLILAQTHDRTCAVYLCNMCNGTLECLFLFFLGGGDVQHHFLFQICFCHKISSFIWYGCINLPGICGRAIFVWDSDRTVCRLPL